MYNKFKGFTLAEVLITLGIIGVVAALTLPSLIQNYQKQVWVQQLKKTVSVFENGFKKAMADDGVDKLQDTELWQSVGSCNGDVSNANCNEFFNKLQKYFKVEYNPGYSKSYSTFNNGAPLINKADIYLPSGVQFGFSGISKTPAGGVYGPHNPLGTIVLDVNGDKKPDKIGRDVFMFGISKYGQMVPYGSRTASKLQCEYNHTMSPNMYPEVPTEECINSTYYNSIGGLGCIDGGMGFFCAARIMENGWKMDY